MEYVGDEKRFRALFCELTLEDESGAPRFESMWRQAESLSPVRGSGRPLNLLLGRPVLGFSIAATLLLLITLLSLNWSTPNMQFIEPQQKLTATIPTPPRIQTALVTPTTHHRPKVVRRRATRPTTKILREAAIIASWQSPTRGFLESPTDTGLKSLPQLNQPVREMESFLPNNEVKEFKQ